MKTAQQGSYEYARKCVMAFLNGSKNCSEKWILGALASSVSLNDAQEIIASLEGYSPDHERLDFLRRACQVA